MSIYDRLWIEIFQRHKGATKDEFEFEREEMENILRSWGERVKNLGMSFIPIAAVDDPCRKRFLLPVIGILEGVAEDVMLSRSLVEVLA